jgi:predicted transcriptional regulator of viral defense system
MKKIHTLKKLGRFPLFTLGDYMRLTGRDAAYSRLYLHRLVSEGLAHRIERGKYTVHEDPLLFASCLRAPSYVSFWSALRFHDLTEQLPRNLMMASPMRAKTLTFQGTSIEFYKMKHMWGYNKARYSGTDIFVAEKEKAVIDCLLLQNTPYGVVEKAVSTGELDEKKLAIYAVRTQNVSLMKRLGFLLKTAGQDAQDLKERTDYNYIPLDWSRASKGKKDPEWKIIINKAI